MIRSPTTIYRTESGPPVVPGLYWSQNGIEDITVVDVTEEGLDTGMARYFDGGFRRFRALRWFGPVDMVVEG